LKLLRRVQEAEAESLNLLEAVQEAEEDEEPWNCDRVSSILERFFGRFSVVGGRSDGSGLVWVLRNAASQRLKNDTFVNERELEESKAAEGTIPPLWLLYSNLKLSQAKANL
jgi:hypothetical protein